MNTPLQMIDEAERLVKQIARLQPPKGSRHAKVQKKAFIRYVRRFRTAYKQPATAGRSLVRVDGSFTGKGASCY